MNIDLQIVFDMISNMFIVAFPISIMLSVVAKVTNIFCSFVFGKEVRL